MSNFIALTRVLLKTGSQSSSNKKNKKKIKGFFLALVLILAFTPMAVGFGKFLSAAYDGLHSVGQEAAILGFGLSVVSIVIFFFGIFYAMSIFYFSMDVENLLPLPLKPWHIMGAKFTVVLIYEYFTEIIFFVPTLIAFGVKSGGGIVYYIYGVVIFLLLPIIPLVMASIINMIIMRFTNIAKNKDRFRLFGGILAMGFGVGINLYIQKFTQNLTQSAITEMFARGNNSLLSLASSIFPSTKVAVNSLINTDSIQGFINLTIFILITIASLIIFIILGQSLYFKGVMGVSETTSKRKTLSNIELIKNTSQSSSLRIYLFKELKLLFRTPIYFMNCVLMNFLFPIFLLIPFFSKDGGGSQLKTITTFLQGDKGVGIVLAVFFAFIVFASCSNAISTTAISREGKNLYILKYIPMKYKDQLIAKVLSAVVLGAVAMIMIIVLGIVLLKITLEVVLLMIIVGSVGILFTSLIGIFIDLNFPKLQWDTEQEAVKRNFNVMISMIICGALGGLTVFVIIKYVITKWIAFALILGLFGILDIVLYFMLGTKGVELLRKIES
ncbi:putative ABC transporter permease subunit [Clostridium lacusfryxellense]|uniref:putative ABC transporter permease subunit n=1 Tax=Clostridium lacusfryxellense TaxID=205328 RepID=UPI001C0AE281|nr:ABC transporter permease [Clostridium lacusfryxellense]MBU3113121.1 ABC transporter permease [Clostridium lacusfryxellense]